MFHTTLLFLPPRHSTVPAALARGTETQPLLRPVPAPDAGPALALTAPASVQLGRWVGHIVYRRDEMGILTVVCGKLERDEQDRRGLFDKLFGLLQGIGWSGTVRLTAQQKEMCLRMESMFAASPPARPTVTATKVTATTVPASPAARSAASPEPDGAEKPPTPPALTATPSVTVPSVPFVAVQARPPAALALQAATALANGARDKAVSWLAQLTSDACANGAGIAALRLALGERNTAQLLWSDSGLRRGAMLACLNIDEWCELFGWWKLAQTQAPQVRGQDLADAQQRRQHAERRIVRDGRLDAAALSAALAAHPTTVHLARCLLDAIRGCRSAGDAAALLGRTEVGLPPETGRLSDAHRKLLGSLAASLRPRVQDYRDATRLAALLAAGAYGTTLEALLEGDGRQRVVQSIVDDMNHLLSVSEGGRRQSGTFLHHTALSLAGFAHGVPAPYGEDETARLLRFPPQSCRPAMALLWQTPNFEEMVLALCKREASLRPDPALEALCMCHPERERAAMLLEALHDATHL